MRDRGTAGITARSRRPSRSERKRHLFPRLQLGMQDSVDEAKRLEANQRKPHLLLVCGRPRDEHRVNQLLERCLLDEQQVLDDELFDNVQLNLDRFGTEPLLDRGANLRQSFFDCHVRRSGRRRCPGRLRSGRRPSPQAVGFPPAGYRATHSARRPCPGRTAGRSRRPDPECATT